MSTTIYMTDLEERQKRVKAGLITLGVAGAMLLLAILLKWNLPTVPAPLQDEYIEINIGSGDEGFGTDQPLLPGDPAPAQQVAYTPPQTAQSNTEDARDVETDDNNPEAVAVRKPVNPKPNATKIDAENKTVKTQPAAQPVAATPAPPKPKAVLGRTVGGSGNGGNGADSYERGGSEGIAGGSGDQGRPGGSPNGRDYTGTPKRFATQIFSLPHQRFEDDFNQNATIAVEVTVDANGKVISTIITPLGSSGTATNEMKNIALRRAKELKFGTSEGGQKGIVKFEFKVRG